MSQGSIIRACAIAGVTSAVLAIGALAGFVVVVGSDPIADAAVRPVFHVPTTAALGSVALLAFGLVGLYLHHEDRMYPLGAVGAGIALLGTMLAVGAQWTYVFAVPHFAAAVPDLVNEGTGSVLAGFLLSYAVLAVGWALFGVAMARTGVFPRWQSVLVIVGGVIAFLPMPSRTLVLSIAVALLGIRTLRDRGAEPRSTPSSVTARR